MPYAPRATNQNPYGPQVTFRTEDVLPPSALYLSMDDTLFAHIVTSGTGLTFTLTVRMLLADGTLTVENYVSTPTVFNPTIYEIIVPPVEGYILSCIVQLGGTLDGSAWCMLFAFKGSVSQPVVVFPPVAGIELIQGYVGQWSWLSWPQSPIVEAGSGAGSMRNITPTLAAGNNWTIQTTSLQRWELISATFNFTTSAVAGNRQMSLVVFDRLGAGVLRIPCNFTQAASLTYSYYFYNSATHQQTNTTWITAPFPQGIFLDTGMSLKSAVVNLDAGDSFANVSVLVREWMGVGHN